jgi:hypothetical protein
MKKAGFVILIGCLVMACNNGGSSTENKLDSIGKKFDSSAARIWDSTKEKAKTAKERVENKLKQRDSARKTDTIK